MWSRGASGSRAEGNLVVWDRRQVWFEFRRLWLFVKILIKTKTKTWTKTRFELVVQAVRLPPDDHHGVGDRVGAGGGVDHQGKSQGRIHIQVAMRRVRMRRKMDDDGDDGEDNVGNDVGGNDEDRVGAGGGVDHERQS